MVRALILIVAITILLMSGQAEAQSWSKIRDAAMRAREQGNPSGAYSLLANTRPPTPNDYVDAQFTAGFIALRSLGRADIALQHFEAMALATGTLRADERPDARSTAGYYMAKSLVALGRDVDAVKVFQAAAVYRDTFYGLLSATQIHATDTKSQLMTVARNYPRLDLKYIDFRTNAALINAIIKPESNFKVTAVSPAGALGLMQLMPGTARKTANEAGVEVNMAAVAYSPEYNVALGSRYFGNLLTRYTNNVMLSASAYNAGELNCDDWIRRFGDPRGGQIDPVDWVELIPFKETRNYVKKVVSAYVTYLTLSQ